MLAGARDTTMRHACTPACIKLLICLRQMKQKKEITEQVAFSLVQFYAVVLFECNEAEDYGPAMTLMNTAFTFHHEGEYSGLSGQLSLLPSAGREMSSSTSKQFTGLPWVWGFPWVWDGYGDCDE